MNDCKNIFCVWINEQFVPCTEMNKNIDDYKIQFKGKNILTGKNFNRKVSYFNMEWI